MTTSTYTDQLITRLRLAYAYRTPLPMPAGSTHHPHCPVMHTLTADCKCYEQTLDLAQLQRLYRCIISEGYGE